MNGVDEEIRDTENNPEEEEEEEELMVSLDRSLNNRSRKKFQKRKLSQQLSTTPLKKRKKLMMTTFTRCLFFSLPQFKLNKKSEQNTIPTKVGVSLSLPQWKVSCAVLRKWWTI
jgi:hypothetical protein